ncbi:hypothetical protein A9G11_03120 [Gilliamella sp. wkB108]|uniref:tail fiber assembly protein n=1 Tax=Gilliamella sp. wkB108 TaxID=3120256 RepID=UPI00080DC1B0|nr:tail fiber assembly protein [Gilliamella apicola]OCG24659.1 hypothetical protein A9G11_03120 [Gilliamella apicola]
MKYQLQPEIAILNEAGFTTTAGWAVIHNVDANTGEYLTATYQYLPIGVGLPAHAYLDAPKNVEDGQAIVRQENQWIYPNDFRGQKIYSIKTGIESTMTKIGEIEKGFTLSKPSSEFDSWDGEKWVLDTNKQHNYYVNRAISQKSQLISEANEKISYLQDALDAEIATEQEILALNQWKKYRVELNRIDVEQADKIQWPEKP